MGKRPTTKSGRRRQGGDYSEHKTGRPQVEPTKELSEKFGQMMLTGAHIDDVCAYFGLHKETYRRWMKRGVAEESEWERTPPAKRGEYGGECHRFRAVVKKGQAYWQLEALTRIRQAAIGRKTTKREYDPATGALLSETVTEGAGAQWTADAWRLERRLPHRYGIRQGEVEIEDEFKRGLVRLVRAFGGTDAEQVKIAIAALASDDADETIDMGALLAEVMREVEDKPAPEPVPA